MKINLELIEYFKEQYEKRGSDNPQGNAIQYCQLVHQFATTVITLVFHEEKLHVRLQNEPDGFPLPDTGKCIVCEMKIDTFTGWFSKYGKTCILCFDAFRDGTLPYFAINAESYFSFSQVQSFFGLKSNAITALIEKGILQPRIVYNPDGSIRYQLFLKKENPVLHEYPNPFQKSVRRYMNRVYKEYFHTIFMKYAYRFSQRHTV